MRAPNNRLCVGGFDELPEEFCDEPNGVYVFDGDVIDTREMTGDEIDALGLPSSASGYEEWWQGSMRAATAEEILAVLMPRQVTT